MKSFLRLAGWALAMGLLGGADVQSAPLPLEALKNLSELIFDANQRPAADTAKTAVIPAGPSFNGLIKNFFESWNRRPPAPLPALSGKPDFSGVPAARSVGESKRLFDRRAAVIVDYWRAKPIGTFGRERAHDFYNPAIARVLTGAGLDEIDKAILDPATRVYAEPGSDFRRWGPLCRRNGDYDFMLQGLIRLAYLLRRHPDGISPQAKSKLYHELLSAKGTRHHTQFELSLCGTWPETENHIFVPGMFKEA